MRNRWVNIFIAMALSAAISYGIGFYAGGGNALLQFPSIAPVEIVVDEGSGKPADFNLSTLWEAYRALKERFVDQNKLDPAVMMEGAVSGFVSSVGDPYTVYVPPQEQKKFVEDLQGSFGGIGAEIGIRKEMLVVISPLEGSPAKRAGLLAGDRILQIDEKTTSDMTLDEAIGHIRGEVGTEVTLVVFHVDTEMTKEVTIRREQIVVPSLKSEIKDGIGIIRIMSFNADTPAAFAKAAQEFRKLDTKKIVVDVRNNPGGYLDAAQDIASWFLARGEAVVYEEDAQGNRLAFPSKGYRGFQDFTIVVLMNEGSASAAEILAGALRDRAKAQLVGVKSFGKGSVQELVDLSDGSVIKITTAKWLTPNGNSINENGLVPDVPVEMKIVEEAESDPENIANDAQLDKALEILKQ